MSNNDEMMENGITENSKTANASDLANKMVVNSFEPKTKKYDKTFFDADKCITASIPGTRKEHIEYAKCCNWKITRSLFDSALDKYVASIKVAMAASDWTDLKIIKIPIAYNLNNGKYCCWEAGGAGSQSGYAFLIGAPDGKRHLALTTFRKFKYPNGKHAVIQIWPSCVVAIAAQSRGVGAVLLYRITDIIPESTHNVDKNTENKVINENYINHFSATLELIEVVYTSTMEVVPFTTELYNSESDKTSEHKTVPANFDDIINVAIKKSITYNCNNAMYVRPFFLVKLNDSNRDTWNMDDKEPCKEIVDNNEVKEFFDDVLNTLSTVVRKMEPGVFPYVGVKVLTNTENITDEEKENYPTVKIRVTGFINNTAKTFDVVINEEIFNTYRDFFIAKNFKAYRDLQFVEDDWRKLSILKYASN